MSRNGGYDHVGGEFISFIPYILVIPIGVYGNIKLYTQYKSAMFVCKRRLSILFGLNISLLLGILAAMNFHLGAFYLGKIKGLNAIIYFSSFWLILFFLITKNWLIYFQYKWQYYSLQISWKLLINKKVADTKNNWFIKNKNRWGKLSYFTKRFAIVAIIGSMCWCFLLFSEFFIFLGMALLLITAVLYIVIICKTPYYKDIFYIHYESKIHAKLLLIAVLIVIVLILLIMNVDEETIGQRKGFWDGILYPFASIIWGIMIYVSTFVIMKKNVHSNIENVSAKLIDAAKMAEYNIELILSHKKGINLFMNHLAKEYSMECLLSYIEFCQYQKYLIQNDVDGMIEAETKDNIKLIDFPEHIPLSQIIEDKEEVENEEDYQLYQHKMKAYKLFKKYVDIHAELQINISWQLRSECAHLIDNLYEFLKYNITMNDLVLLFEDIKKEMRMLLYFALVRFKTTDEFEQIVQIFTKNDETSVHSTNLVREDLEM